MIDRVIVLSDSEPYASVMARLVAAGIDPSKADKMIIRLIESPMQMPPLPLKTMKIAAIGKFDDGQALRRERRKNSKHKRWGK